VVEQAGASLEVIQHIGGRGIVDTAEGSSGLWENLRAQAAP
jgi:hypothetical protein